MNRYMPITGHDCNIPYLLIDTQAPVDVLHDAAAYRIRAVTQLLENFVEPENARSHPMVLQELTLVCTILLRDGCDLLDVTGRKLQEQISA
ncbi:MULTISPECIES: hypothetical protein [Pseudomonas]|uniref:Short-chain dehydrogenase n=2 Tax=Pseudomonas chlororaphis TaxID=587753 RepID=A0AAP9VY03_9PSED|nr:MULTISPECIES: hypothetical protein [Pseudomonas]BBN53473.1 hypothetical protein TRE132_15980 [Pseudomonas chlororaphis subsp. aurantiaca]AUG39758.1 hypothetical protein CXP47_07625 [Pseudomonas chlororaphis]AZD84408.1 hypothetical protein C4K14_1569 [Pseudomonas chlororaphis subsp. aureofaciens]AZD91002.1 hypothetical protein C4K13_1570 [Pseudomonas chlororaphis subsp. aureofaciens]AZD97467.1 hypothetical protein C4K12_1586 [Pseudomonas chlororaphis subsp. aureofaciens]